MFDGDDLIKVFKEGEFQYENGIGKRFTGSFKKYRKEGEDIGFGHSKATGGIVEEEVFRDFLSRLGF